MNEATCKICQHYRVHYVKWSRSYLKLEEGHCVHPRLKNREDKTPACKHFKQVRDTKKED